MISLKTFLYLLFLLSLLLSSCARPQQEVEKEIDRTTTIGVTTNLILGKEEDPIEEKFGRPVFVRTDEEGTIFVADEGSMNIKMFDHEGNFIRTLGRSGRGPNEFSGINLMEITPEGNIGVLDASTNQRLTIMSKEGENIGIQPMNFFATRASSPSQFLPHQVIWNQDNLIGLQFRSRSLPAASGFIDELFWVYSSDFQDSLFAFGSYMELDSTFEHPFALGQMSIYPGSFAVAPDGHSLVYSPGIYSGSIYLYRMYDTFDWRLDTTIQGVRPWYGDPYMVFSSLEDASIVPDRLPYAGERYYGRTMSMDSGVFLLEDGRVVNFVGEWRKGENETFSHLDNWGYLMDISVQVFDQEGNLLDHSYLFSLETYLGLQPQINWKDNEDNFYLINTDNSTIERFTLDITDYP